MMKFKLSWLVLFVLAVALVGCGGNKATEESKEAAPATPAAAPAAVNPDTVGEISGMVSFEGTAPPRVRIKMDAVPACTQANKEPVMTEEVVVNENKTLKNVFIYVK